MAIDQSNRVNLDERLSGAIESIYSGITESADELEQLPSRLADVFDARTVNLFCFDTDLNPSVAVNYGLTGEQLQEYMDHWIDLDPLMEKALTTFLGSISTPETLVGPDAYPNLPVYEGFYAPHYLHRQVARFDRVQAGWIAGISFQRPEADPPITQSDRQRLEYVAAHLRRAWKIALRMGVLSTRVRSAEGIVANCRLATWLIDGNRYVHANNREARRIEEQSGTGVANGGGHVRFCDSKADAALREGLRQLDLGGREPVELPVKSTLLPHFVWGLLLPVDQARNSFGYVQRMYMLVLAKPGTEQDIRWEQLQQRLGISRVEAMVLVELMRGVEPTTIAEKRGSSLHTIRSYEKSLRSKLGCHSRASLVAEGWRAMAVIPLTAAKDGSSVGDRQGGG